MGRKFLLGLLGVAPLFFLVTLLTFGLLLLVPGEPAITLAGENPTPEQVAVVKQLLGLDRNYLVQYLSWVSNAVRGDFGVSLYTQSPVSELVFDRLPATFSLALFSMLFGTIFGVAFGIVAAMTRDSLFDRFLSVLSSLGIAIPSFWLGLIFITQFAFNLDWLPALGYVPLTQDPILWMKYLLLPSLTLGLTAAAEIARQVRGALCETLSQEYIRTAKAKGMTNRNILFKHALKNAGIPAVTVIGVQFSYLLGGSVIVEQIFGIPGIGSLAVSSVVSRDLPVLQCVVILSAVAVLLCNILVDTSYLFFNPKLRK